MSDQPSIFVYVSSLDRVQGTSTDFVLPPIGNFPSGSSFRINIKQISFPNLVSTIRTGINDTLQFYYDSTLTTVSIPAGNYTGTTLATAMQTALQTVDNNFAVTSLGDASSSLQLTVPNTHTFLPFVLTPKRQPSDRFSVTERLLLCLGWLEWTNITVSGVNTAPEPVSLDGTAFVDVEVNCDLQTYHTSGYISNVLQRVPLLQPYRAINYYETRDLDDGQFLHASQLSRLRIRLIDSFGDVYLLPPHVNVSIVFKLTQYE